VRDDALPELQRCIAELGALARDAGLDPLPTHFELVPAPILYEVAAYGVPGRFAHWSYGKAYRALKAQYDLGLVKYFELVVHGDPAQAFLLDSNDLLTNKLVAAHVLGHSDFFHHNAHFAGAGRDMPERAALHAQRLRAYEFAHGRAEVEGFLDAVLAIEEHVDPGAGLPAPGGLPPRRGAEAAAATFADLFPRPAPRRPARPAEPGRQAERGDLLLFLLRHAEELADWQRDALAIVREEALYFRPQLLTKVSNEGWATLWHCRLLRQLPLSDGEYLDFARLNASVRTPQPGGVNPYLLGVAIYEDILERLGEEAGLRECLLLREVEDDAAFLRNHFTREVAERLDMFVFGRSAEAGQEVWKVTTKDFATVRDTLVRRCENGGRPLIAVADVAGGELVLEHRHDGRDLELRDAQKTLQHVARVWGRRCRLRTAAAGEAAELLADPPAP